MTDSEQLALKCITSLARQYCPKVCPHAGITYDDLVQEGWIVYWRLMTTKRIRWEGGQFTALLKLALTRKLRNIVRDSHTPKRSSVWCDSEGIEAVADRVESNPERQVMIGEAVAAIKKDCPALAEYLTEGGTAADFGFIRYLQRQRQRPCWTTDGMRYRWTPELIKLIFNFDTTSFPLYGYI